MSGGSRASDRIGPHHDRMSLLLASLLADRIAGGDLALLFYIVALLCVCGAAYLAYLGNIVGAVLLVFVAVVAVILA